MTDILKMCSNLMFTDISMAIKTFLQGRRRKFYSTFLKIYKFIYLAASSLSCHMWDLSFFFSFIFIIWRLITLQHCSGFCHTLTWISHGFTCIPHPDPPSHLPLHLIPLGLPSTPGPSTCLMHPAWAGDLFHPR